MRDMIRNCPRCQRERLDEGKYGEWHCSACGGLFVPRSHLVELMMSGQLEAATGGASASSDRTAARCPADASIMSAAEIALPEGTGAVRVDRCGSCLGVWFDAGEWSSLATGHLLARLDEFWTAEWRSRQRHERERAEAETRLKEQLGTELYAEIAALAATLRGHPRRSQALAILREWSA
jgi:Zn-finger nucleic acid-binding protein